MKKKELRNLYKEKRRQLSATEKIKFTDLILINFQKINFPAINCVHTYLAMDDEVETWQMIKFLEFRNPGVQVCVPKIDTASGVMKNFLYDEDIVMSINNFGIEEPSAGEKIESTSIDLVLTPLLTFDKFGHRLGFGKGYYDKFFATCRKDVIKVGLSFFDPVDIIEDTNQFDITLNYCATPERLYQF